MSARGIGVAVFASFPVRHLTLLGIALVRGVSRLWSAMRTAALFPAVDRLVCHWSVEVKYREQISFGSRVVIGPGCTLGAAAPIRLGNHVRLSRDVLVETAGLDFTSGEPPYSHRSAPITIEDGVWIGARALILGGVTLGANAVIAAGSVVTRDVPAGCVAGGVPARVLVGKDGR